MLGIIAKAQITGQEFARKLASDNSGATSIEYALIAGGISIAIIGSVFAIGDELVNVFTLLQTTMADPPLPPAGNGG